jgi:glycosyltransferase involved in cell wall biosynthesis
MNTVPPQVAVIVPAYNASAYIEDTINSVLGQSKPAVEIVVVDDGSTDNTAGVVAGISAKVTIVRQKNGGQGSARQHGVEATTAGLLLFLDADDILRASALEKLSAALLCHPLAALVYCPAEMWSPTGQIPSRADTLSEPVGEDFWGTMLRGSFIRTPGCVLLRRTALNEVGGWDPDLKLKGNEDWELWLRLAEKHSFVRVGEPLLKYRMHDTGFSKSRFKMFKSMFAMLKKQHSRWKQNPGRRQAVEAAEWRNCKYASLELWGEVRSAWSKGRVLQSMTRISEIIRIGTRPMLAHAFNSAPRRALRWWRVLCGREKSSQNA